MVRDGSEVPGVLEAVLSDMKPLVMVVLGFIRALGSAIINPGRVVCVSCGEGAGECVCVCQYWVAPVN